MRQVLNAIEAGVTYRPEIVEATKMDAGRVKSAIYNLVFVGLVTRTVDSDGRHRYDVAECNSRKITTGKCLLGVSSVFNPRLK